MRRVRGGVAPRNAREMREKLVKKLTGQIPRQAENTFADVGLGAGTVELATVRLAVGRVDLANSDHEGRAVAAVVRVDQLLLRGSEGDRREAQASEANQTVFFLWGFFNGGLGLDGRRWVEHV